MELLFEDTMPVSILDVKVGKFFVCGYRVREVFREDTEGNVVYYSYLLETGAALYESPDMCSKSHLSRVADREATPAEIARMKTEEARSSDEFQSIGVARELLSRMPDDWLIEEVKRRGLF